MKIIIENDIWGFDLTAALEEISPQRREQALRYRHELGQRLCVLAYLLLKRGLNEVFGISENPLFEYGEHGKPSIGRYKENLVGYTMNDKECSRIMGSGHPEVEFIRLWTMKEALLKLTGEGISSDMKTALTDAGNYHFETVIEQEKRYIYTVCEENEE